jgi:hypothetical protein
MSQFEDDEESQRRGVVGLLYFLGPNAMEFDRDLQSSMPRTMDWLPCRTNGLHLCSDDRFLLAFKSLLMATMGRNRRVRLRIRDGTSYTY